MCSIVLWAVAVSAGVCVASLTWAEPKSRLVVGAGVVVSEGGYRGESPQLIPVPVIIAERGRWFFEGIRGGVRLVEAPIVGIDLVVGPRFEPFEEGDSAELAGLEERRTTLEGGFDVTVQPRQETPISFGLSAVHDLLGQHNGMAVGAKLSYRLDRGWWALTPRLTYTWYDSDLMHHLVGVSAWEAREGRLAYSPGSETAWGAGFHLRFPIVGRWALTVIGSWERFGDDYRESPLVESAAKWTTVFAVGYDFSPRRGVTPAQPDSG